MVSGFTKFKERFQGFENQYVIISGTACDLIMENEELPFRIAITSMQELLRLRLRELALTREPPARHSRSHHVRSGR